MPATTFQQILEARIARRGVLKGLALGAALVTVGRIPYAYAQEEADFTPFSFASLPPVIHKEGLVHELAEGYRARALLSWGDALFPKMHAFNPATLTAQEQTRRFGFNCDFTAYFPLPYGSANSHHGLLCVNHETAWAEKMLPNYSPRNHRRKHSEIEMAAMGMSVVEIRQEPQGWQVVLDSKFNRRISTLSTPVRISGMAAGHPRMCTTHSPKGKFVRGMIGNCGGGITPWGTVLTCEENFNEYFGGRLTAEAEAENYKRYGIVPKAQAQWYRHLPRFNVGMQPREANRFGWVVEIDPYSPKSTPVKRTALGRIKHETATCVLNHDGRLVIYSGDDEVFQFLYKFVSRDKVNMESREANRNLLDKGTLYVAQFHEDGRLKWLPLIQGEGKLTARHGFHAQADVLIETRRAAELVGATPMDRPEGIAVSPVDGRVYVSLTNNRKREEINAANPRPQNAHGHIIELVMPLAPNGKQRHGAEECTWEIFLLGGQTEEETLEQGPLLHEGINWLSCPDNLAFDPRGNLWVATDGQPKSSGVADSLYMVETKGFRRGIPRRFFNAPAGAEVTGPCFTPDGSTLFLSVQHPDGHWPDLSKDMPARPSVIAIERV